MLENFEMNHWAWAGIALLLAILELAAPGVFFLWLAIAALLTAVIAGLAPGLGWEIHLAIFAILAVVVTGAGRRYVRLHPTRSTDEGLNRRSSHLIGQVYPLAEAIKDGTGRVKVGDSSWLARGPDLPRGARVRITAIDGASLLVEPEQRRPVN